MTADEERVDQETVDARNAGNYDHENRPAIRWDLDLHDVASDRPIEIRRINDWAAECAMDVNGAVLNFQAFLNAGYATWRRSAVVMLEKEMGYLDEAFYDWAQANWELIVERALCNRDEFLEIYGAGSDYEAKRYSRVFFHDAMPTHEIFCELADGTTIEDVLTGRDFHPAACGFEGFVARIDGWYEDQPPFDHVLLEDEDTQYLAAVSSVKFGLRAIGARPNPPLQT